MTQKLLLIERKDRICALTLNRPEKKNSLSLDMIDLLGTTLKELTGNDGLRVVILRGAGDKAFCFGFDIGLLPTQPEENTAQRIRSMDQVERLLQHLVFFPYPVLAIWIKNPLKKLKRFSGWRYQAKILGKGRLLFWRSANPASKESSFEILLLTQIRPCPIFRTDRAGKVAKYNLVEKK